MKAKNGSILFAMMFLVVLALAACNSGKQPKGEEAKEPAPKPAASNGVIGADYCLETFMKKQNALPSPVHFLYKVANSDKEAKRWEGDLTSTTADFVMLTEQPSTPDLAQNTSYKIHDGLADFTNTFHYDRSQDHEWQMAPTMPVQSATPWGEFVNKPTTEQAGPETVNGFETVKYNVDNSKQDLMERVGFSGAKDYIVKGTVWITKDSGCILQWKMDSQTTHKDGTVRTVHYEGTVTKK
ncbi:MAG TPA: hypothetical protein VFU86_21030 [Terriglobales bacterium]|nr:hypothetical protein [Terriglobales bacterium]